MLTASPGQSLPSIDSALHCRPLFNGPAQNESAVILVRSRLLSVARRMGFSDLKRENMALVAAEMVSNVVKHAGGRGLLQIWQQPGPTLDLLALDYGPGIGNLDRACRDGFSTRHTLGKGLGSINRLSDEVAMYSRPGNRQSPHWSGTAILARFHAHDRAVSGLGLFCRAMGDARDNGDHIYLHEDGLSRRWLHLDGLGHGERAQRATAGLGGLLTDAADPETVLGRIHRALRGTRGAVAIVADHIPSSGRVRLLGVGDMHAHLLDATQNEVYSFAPGVLGQAHRGTTLTELTLRPGQCIVTASDGLRRNWNERNFTGLAQQHPQLIAYLLGNIMGRLSDDQSVCVVAPTTHPDPEEK